MGSKLLVAAAVPTAKLPSIPSTATTTTTTLATAADGTTTTISSLGQDQLLEIFLRLPNLPALVRAALTCPSWLDAVRSSPSFRRQFRSLHPAPLLGVFREDDGPVPSFTPLRRRDPDVAAALRRGDFFLTSLPEEAHTAWHIHECRDGYILLWGMMSLAAVNPMTWTANIIPLPDDLEAGGGLDCYFLDFLLLSSDENPWSFQVVCVCMDQQRVRTAIFSTETWDWAIHPWVEIGGDNSLDFSALALVDGSVYLPVNGEARMIRINTATMGVTSVDLPSQVQVNELNFRPGETKDGELCIVYASNDFLLHVWIRGTVGDGIESWVPQSILSLSADIARFTHGRSPEDLDVWPPEDLDIWQVTSGHAYFCVKAAGTCWFFSLPLETMEIELLLIQGAFGSSAGYLYVMAWPPSLVGDDGSTGHDELCNIQ